MFESSKSIFRKLNDSRYATRFLIGNGIDIGAGNDSLTQYREFFPLMQSCRGWDIEDGDAQYMHTISDDSYDFVHSSHCIERLEDPYTAMANWVRILKPGGHLICLVPDEDLYEQRIFPSLFNPDHKRTFTIYKRNSWCQLSVNIFDLLSSIKYDISVLKIELLDSTYRYSLLNASSPTKYDQTSSPIGEASIEIVIKKL